MATAEEQARELIVGRLERPGSVSVEEAIDPWAQYGARTKRWDGYAIKLAGGTAQAVVELARRLDALER